MNQHYLITINWNGQVFSFYRHATSAAQALRFAIRQLAREVGYSTCYVRNHVMSGNRYEVKIV